jgi:hypothetical protein
MKLHVTPIDAPKLTFGGKAFAAGLTGFFDQFPETVNPWKLKLLIDAYFAKRQLSEIREIKGHWIDAQLKLAEIIPIALYHFYDRALRIPTQKRPERHQFNALEIALNCLDAYLPQLVKRTELGIDRAMKEAMMHAFAQEAAFEIISSD